jgi:hypothetical protein
MPALLARARIREPVTVCPIETTALLIRSSAREAEIICPIETVAERTKVIPLEALTV